MQNMTPKYRLAKPVTHPLSHVHTMRLQTLVDTKLNQQLRRGSTDLRRVVGHLLVLDVIEITRQASALTPPAPPSTVKAYSTTNAATTKIGTAYADAELYNVPALDAPSDDDTTSSPDCSSDEDDEDDELAFDDEADFEHTLVRVASHSTMSVGRGKLEFLHCAQRISEVLMRSKREGSEMVVASVVEIVDLDG
ncbi:hypothetical protein BDY17DRAFT_66151 [Neohortaea acidophila]|uniref:Uncharacterized protein n=1 Tax=Neohortaea acidophila TaxID=245834 RepID=A0A6A6PEW1_9PEZI|nr:uncharacterized protein BDY17DRAFT_66151 [Neohortaea acidophila]KAF2478465.1 hypothetical protein BDY17DRAFT_66151 [Neohortaea acidophila]